MVDRGRAASQVLIASPMETQRDRWRQALEGVFDVQEADDRAALDRNLTALKPAILLLDLALPRLGGINGLPAVRRLSPTTKTVVFTVHPHEKEGISALRAGAMGYCETDLDPVLLKKAVALVQNGEVWVRRNFIPCLIEELASLTDPRQKRVSAKRGSRLGRLTPREREIVSMIGKGQTNKEIAARLRVKENTVKAHLTAVFRKLELTGRVRLALFINERERRPIASVQPHARAEMGSRRPIRLKSN